MTSTRRHFLATTALAAAGLAAPRYLAATPTAKPRAISCNQYTWFTFYQRDGKDWAANLDASLAEYVQSGLTAYEPSFTQVEEVGTLAPLLKKYHLAMPSAYVNSTLHKTDDAKASITTALAIAEAGKPLGLQVLVTNPSPLRWGGEEIKNDAELAEQAKNLNYLGAELRKRGITLAYHTHDVEMRAGAREFHHMLQATDPQNVSFCFDVHWIYRGSGNSQLAVFDVLKLYGARTAELHVRQSVGGTWAEAFGAGDIDYPRLVSELKAMGVRPHVVLEQCIEAKSPRTLSALEAHQQSLRNAQTVFGPLLG
ncbi:hypothetical protein GCM10027275_51320 [Rhabdobacter roseus]|uniref:Inosose dehydratase n=1 Tax=Rhabdobacter roseus TaxID=1655419 RepID=A0A840TS64_9BACT|nr:sugar phosphate isomerase/epimerase [Rhabdobacter roseus]MBB5287206.1 inosose dehydratase [Rhabdobacter roseus]